MIIRTHRSKLLAAIHLVVVWLIPPFLVTFIVNRNFDLGRYDPSADSLSIPIGGAYALFALGVIYFGVIATVYNLRLQPGVGIFSFHRSWGELLSWLLVLPGIVVIGAQALYWAVPHHYLLFVAYLLPVHWLILARAGIASGWLPNKSFKRDRPKRAAP